MDLTRRQFVSCLSLAAAVPGYAFGLERNWLELTSHTVVLPCLPPGVQVRILQLSDLHVSSNVPFSLMDRAISMGLDAKPDLTCRWRPARDKSHCCLIAAALL